MMELTAKGISTPDIIIINNWRIYFKVTFLSEMSDAKELQTPFFSILRQM
jgi:hypothetical protein